LRDVLVQALLDAPMFEVRWRWNATRALAIQRNRAGKRVPPQFQRMAAEDFVAQVFPDQLACQENISGPRQVPSHPLVRQTVDDCLHEAMDIDTLETLVGRIEAGGLRLVARDLREPSPFAQEIITARPYAFLDDAPFEERRTLAIRNRSWLDPAEAEDYGALDPNAIARVKDEAWPWIRNAEELHEALMLLGFMTVDEMHSNDEQPDNSLFLDELVRTGRATQVQRARHRLWIASERWPWFAALSGNWQCKPAVNLPATLDQAVAADEALVEMLRGRLEGLGPVTAQTLAAPLGLSKSEVMPALLRLEAEGFAFQGQYSPLLGRAPDDKEWCERRLLQRIHRYTIDAHRESIKPVSLQVYLLMLFDLHEIRPLDEAPTASSQESLRHVLRRLDGYTAPAMAWEGDILPARLSNYEPGWLDQLCVSGQVSWGRLLQPRDNTGEARKAGPIKSTPLNLVQRGNLDLWQTLADGAVAENFSAAARQVLQVLQQRGASFFADICRHGALLESQAETALAELVSAGVVTSDSFTGLRALLAPSASKARGRRERRRPLYNMESAGRWSLLQHGQPAEQGEAATTAGLDAAQMDRLVQIYCERWGVLSRSVLEQESGAPPWRDLLRHLRRMELRGELRGGRFISGVGGEQFALSDTVGRLRRKQQEFNERAQLPNPQPARHVINATDPLNLLGVLLPERRVAHLGGNRILFEDGIATAVLERDQVVYLRPVPQARQWELQQLLQRRNFPPRLRAYLGKG
ncbi:MAG TPA: ATP-dependent DNA helicase, partial [Hyphomicrobiales bacterium]|nr:ATP-dependent DNA helicase [Hyphomicrobiales bacterium]